jgi:hypothetical protein
MKYAISLVVLFIMTLPSDDKSSSSLPPSNSSSRGTGILIGCLVMLGIALLAFTGLVMTNTNTIQQTQSSRYYIDDKRK